MTLLVESRDLTEHLFPFASRTTVNDRYSEIWVSEDATSSVQRESRVSVARPRFEIDLSVLHQTFTVEDRTEDKPPVSVITYLEYLVMIGDQRSFIETAQGVTREPWSVADFVVVTRLALSIGAHILARRLASQGAEVHPDSEVLSALNRLLSPPKVLRHHLPPHDDVSSARQWLESNGSAFKDKWVALRNGSLVASADTPKELRAQLDSPEGLLITRVG